MFLVHEAEAGLSQSPFSCQTKVFMMRHLLMSNLLASKVHEIALFLTRISEREL